MSLEDTQTEERPLTDHDVQRATYGFLRMFENLSPDAISAITRTGRGVHTANVSKLVGVISHAIAGFTGYDADRAAQGQDPMIQGVDCNLTPGQRRALKSTLLPELDAEVRAFSAAICALVQTAYDSGVKDGSDLLSGLASGRTSVADFNKKTSGV